MSADFFIISNQCSKDGTYGYWSCDWPKSTLTSTVDGDEVIDGASDPFFTFLHALASEKKTSLKWHKVSVPCGCSKGNRRVTQVFPRDDGRPTREKLRDITESCGMAAEILLWITGSIVDRGLTRVGARRRLGEGKDAVSKRGG